MTPYVTVAEADEYVENFVLDSEQWIGASERDKLVVLRRATRDIDRLKFKGSKTLLTQELEFPRNGLLTVPGPIKQACIEIAVTLLDGVDVNLAEENLNTLTDAYGNVRSTYDTSIRQDHQRAGIHSVTAWRLLLPYLADPLAIKLA